MNRIDERFLLCRNQRRNALVGFLTGGDPNLEDSLAILDAACTAGLDLLELGVPFSDPTADGPTIQKASQRALSSGASLAGCLKIAALIRQKFSDLPIILFGYYNPIVAYGPQRLVRDAMDAGIDGFLCVDLPVECSCELTQFIPSGAAFSPIWLIAPTTSEGRMKMILAQASGFVYIQSRSGVTGVRNTPGSTPVDFIKQQANRVRQYTDLPTVVGFGISSPEDVAAVTPYCDGTVIGSALIKIIEKHVNKNKDKFDRTSAIEELSQYIAALKNANRVTQ